MAELTSRERFRKAINHEEPDRIPIDLGQDFHNGIHEVAYRNLLKHLGETDEIVYYDQMQHLCVCKESILDRFHVDTRYVFANPPEGFKLEFDEEGGWSDEFGIRRKSCGLYDESYFHPLKACSLEDVKKYKFPNPTDPSRFTGIRERAKHLTETTDYAVIGGNAASFFYLTSEMIGFQEYLEKLLMEPAMIHALIERMLEWQISFFDKLLEQIGDYVEVIWMGDDWGNQQGPIVDPALFKSMFKPAYKAFTASIKKKYDVKIALHSCGAVKWALEDFIDCGIDILHPLQGDAKGLNDPEEINRLYGKDLVFYSNISNQQVLPNGTAEEVREDAIRRIRGLAPGGGYIFSGGHNFQADVKPENFVSLIDTAYEFGRYPIKL